MRERIQFTFDVTTQQVLDIADAFVRRYTTRGTFDQNPPTVYWDDFRLDKLTDARVSIRATGFKRWGGTGQVFIPDGPVVSIELFPREIEVTLLIARRDAIESLNRQTGIEHDGLAAIIAQADSESRVELEQFFNGLVDYLREKLGAVTQPTANEASRAATEVAQPEPPTTQAQGVMPTKPNQSDPLDKWFEYYHACKRNRIRYTLKDLAKDVHQSHGYIRQEHTKYQAEHGDE